MTAFESFIKKRSWLLPLFFAIVFILITLPGIDWGDIVYALKEMPLEVEGDQFWYHWMLGWSKRAKDYQERAELLESDGCFVGAAELYQSASVCYHWAEFMYFQDIVIKTQLRCQVTRCFEKTFGTTNLVPRQFSFPFEGQKYAASLFACMGKNPQTGAAIEIKASKSVGFKAGKSLKDAVNG